MSEGQLVVLEGIDGSGKSTVSRHLTEALKVDGVDARWTCEPTRTPTGEAVRRSLADADAVPASEAFLFIADHVAHVAWIRGELSSAPSRVIVSDRYADSNYAYQGAVLADALQAAGYDDPVGWFRDLQAPFHRDPDLAILLDLPVEAALARVDGRGDAAKFERTALLEAVRANYLRLADDLPYYEVVDATREPAEVLGDVEALARRHLRATGVLEGEA